MPFIAAKFQDFNSFAQASISDIIDVGPSSKGQHKEAYMMASTYFVNQGNKRFEAGSLPIEAQFGPITSLIEINPENEKNKYILGAGNFFDVEVETIRHDGNIGSLLSIDKQNNLYLISNKQTGLYLPYNVRKMNTIDVLGETILLVASSSDYLRAYDVNELLDFD